MAADGRGKKVAPAKGGDGVFKRRSASSDGSDAVSEADSDEGEEEEDELMSIDVSWPFRPVMQQADIAGNRTFPGGYRRGQPRLEPLTSHALGRHAIEVRTVSHVRRHLHDFTASAAGGLEKQHSQVRHACVGRWGRSVDWEW